MLVQMGTTVQDGKMEHNIPRLLADILAQPESLKRVLEYHTGAGFNALVRAGEQLMSGRRVIITGMGASMYAAQLLDHGLGQLGTPATLIEAAELLHYRLPICRDAVVVLVSRSGESVEIARLLESFDESTMTIGITNEPGSGLALKSNIPVLMRCRPDEMVAIQTYTATAVVALLLAGLASNGIEAAVTGIRQALAVLPDVIETQYRRMGEWDPILEGPGPVYLLGRGPSASSVHEGALLFNETAKAPSVGMLAASFRHGPVELVDANFTGIVFAPNGVTRALNVALAQDLVRFGGQVRLIGPAGADTGDVPVCEVPELSELFAPLVEIVPVQFAALRLAELRGLEIGAFKYTPLVTRDEASFGCVVN